MSVRGVLVVAVLLLAACGDDDDSTAVSSATLPAAQATTAAAPLTLPDWTGATDELTDCEAFDGRPTIEVASYFDSGGACGHDRGLAEREHLIPGVGDEQCTDGTALYWNDVGWGPSEGTWTFSEDGLPPDDVLAQCRG
jgi:hypothetical protein